MGGQFISAQGTRANAITSASARSGDDCPRFLASSFALDLHPALSGVPVTDAGELGLRLRVRQTGEPARFQPLPE